MQILFILISVNIVAAEEINLGLSRGLKGGFFFGLAYLDGEVFRLCIL